MSRLTYISTNIPLCKLDEAHTELVVEKDKKTVGITIHTERVYFNDVEWGGPAFATMSVSDFVDLMLSKIQIPERGEES